MAGIVAVVLSPSVAVPLLLQPVLSVAVLSVAVVLSLVPHPVRFAPPQTMPIAAVPPRTNLELHSNLEALVVSISSARDLAHMVAAGLLQPELRG